MTETPGVSIDGVSTPEAPGTAVADRPAAGSVEARAERDATAGGGVPRPRASAHRPAVAWSAEVQALRALAVSLVLVYHLWPGRVSGGYVGVDVFFVISGYLITGNILRDLSAHQFSLTGFYVRRAARLLPAAMLVLLVTGVGVVLLLPRTQWIAAAQQLLASATYVQNWVLAGQAVDYLSPDAVPTPVQHFWSLSVEEQFYFFWPLALLLTARAARRAGRRTRVRILFGVMVAVAVASFGYGVVTTAADPAGAYFFSTTRVWEFAAGGVLAIVLSRGRRRVRRMLPARAVTPPARLVLCWAGLVAILAAALLYTEETPFPGWAALLPVAGTVAVIGAGRMAGPFSPARIVRARPTQLLGDVSYSLYLWHWPLIVLVPVALGTAELNLPGKLGVLVLSVALAWLTLNLVENRLRATTRGLRRPRRAFAVIAVTGVGACAVAAGAWYDVTTEIRDAKLVAARALADGTPCFGAAAMTTPGCEAPFGDGVVTPSPAAAAESFREASMRQECFTEPGDATLRRCDFGPADAGFHVVLFGDSHALQWLWAMRDVSERQGWRLTTLLRANCTPSDAVMRRGRTETASCHAWVTGAIDAIAADSSVDLVVTTAYNNKTWQPEAGKNAYDTGVEGYRRTWQRLTAGGRQVAVVKDTPRPRADADDCVAKSLDGSGCDHGRKKATRGREFPTRLDPMVAAVGRSDPRAVHLVDLTDVFCSQRRCPAVIGNVLVYADGHHITPTFSRTVAPELESRLAPYAATAT